MEKLKYGKMLKVLISYVSCLISQEKNKLHLLGKIAIVYARFIFHYNMKSKSLFLLTGIFSLACFLGTTQAAQTDSLPTNVNFEKVEAARLNWQNQERTKLDIPTYTGSDLLEKSAQARAETLKTKGTTTHKRLATDGYYNYRSIRSRFADQGVAFKNEEGTMFTESLGR